MRRRSSAHSVASVPSPAMAVPPSLHASLMARLDRLGSAKELAQIGAAIGREFSHAVLAAVGGKPEAKLETELDSIIRAGLLFRQGVPPNATYLFKHALVQDAAYGLLLREPRRELHARIAETLESRFSEMAENKPEVLARHYAEAGQVEKAAAFWGKAGQRSLARSALVEATEQLRRALDLIATLPGTPARRREEIKLQVALITPLLHVSGYAAPETRAAVERARLLIEQAEALGEPPEDPLLLFSVLYGFWVANLVAFNGDVMRELAVQFLALADKQSATGPRMVGHRLMGLSLLHIGDIANARSASRSRVRPLRRCRASSAGDALWPGRRRGNPVLEVVGPLAARLSAGRVGRHRARAQGCARDRPLRDVDVRAQFQHMDPCPLRELCGSKRARR